VLHGAAQGALALYRGVGPTLLGILPYAGLAFFTFESTKQVQ
jgi:solute carrier family 25 protein 16